MRHVVAAYGVALLAVATACGGGSSGAFADRSGNDIARASIHEMDTVRSLRMTGDLHTDGAHESFDLMLDTAGDCRGIVGVGRARAEILAVSGQVWLKPNVAFLEKNAPGRGKELAAELGGRWLIEHDTPLAGVCDFDTFMRSFRGVESSTSPNATKIGSGTVGGVPAELIQGYGSGTSVTGWVATTGKHYLLKLRVTGASVPDTITFSHFDEPVGAHAPDPSQVVDLGGSQTG